MKELQGDKISLKDFKVGTVLLSDADQRYLCLSICESMVFGSKYLKVCWVNLSRGILEVSHYAPKYENTGYFYGTWVIPT